LASPFGAKIKNSNLRIKSAGEPSQRASQQRYFLTGGVLSKKFELISPKICRAGGIPPTPLPPARRSDPFGLKKLPKNLKKYLLELHFGPKAGFPHF
jgi:hypothetical protein